MQGDAVVVLRLTREGAWGRTGFILLLMLAAGVHLAVWLRRKAGPGVSPSNLNALD